MVTKDYLTELASLKTRAIERVEKGAKTLPPDKLKGIEETQRRIERNIEQLMRAPPGSLSRQQGK